MWQNNSFQFWWSVSIFIGRVVSCHLMLDAVHLQHVLVESEEINKAMSYCAAQ